jgi:hypothetical protein
LGQFNLGNLMNTKGDKQMFRKISLILFVLALGLTAASPAFAAAGGRPGSPVVVYVTSQKLYYDSIVGPALPSHGPFQKLEMKGPTGLQTEFGPGDQGYVGGRWWVDANGNGEMDAEDAYFSCPLLGPGRETP